MAKKIDVILEKTKERALRVLDQPGVYNHLYAISAKYASQNEQWEVERRLDDLWSLIYDITFSRLDDCDRDSQLSQLRELAGRYLSTPDFHSMYLRNRLAWYLFDVAEPPFRIIEPSERQVWIVLAIALLIWLLLPSVFSAFTSALAIVLLVFALWLFLRLPRIRKIEAIRTELASGNFNDEVVKKQLVDLVSRNSRLPTIIIDLLNQKPPIYSDAELEQFLVSIPCVDGTPLARTFCIVM